MTRYIVLDTETTDATPERGVAEVGWQEINEHFEVIDSVSSLIDPECLICPSASAVHGIVQADVQDSPTLEEFFTDNAPGCYGQSITGPTIVIGHRIEFDLHTVQKYIPDMVGYISTLRLSRYLFPQAPAHNLGTLTYLFDLPREGDTHRVLADVDRTRHLLKYICDTNKLSLSDVYALCQSPLKVHTMPFGKHKGEAIEDIPKSYRKWLLGTDIDPDLRWTVEQTM